jgi:hypothetical protein
MYCNILIEVNTVLCMHGDVVTQLENLRHRILTIAWLLTFPGPHTGLSTPDFREGFAMLLCIPSTA